MKNFILLIGLLALPLFSQAQTGFAPADADAFENKFVGHSLHFSGALTVNFRANKILNTSVSTFGAGVSVPYTYTKTGTNTASISYAITTPQTNPLTFTSALAGVTTNHNVAFRINGSNIFTNTTTTQAVDTPNTTLIVTEAGSIATTADDIHGIHANSAATNAIIINNGTITTTGSAAYGIYSQGANAKITHSGVITTTNNGTHGILAIDGDSEITVSGRISATGADSFAIHGGNGVNAQTLNLEGNYDIANGEINLGGGTDTVNIIGIGTGTTTQIVFRNVENINLNSDPSLSQTTSGNVITVTIDRTPLSVIIDNAQTSAQTITSNRELTITAQGSIAVSGVSAIKSTGDNTTITMTGSISTAGTDGIGIELVGDNVVITNQGAITTTGVRAHGITASSNATITHSGIIKTTGTSANGIVSSHTNTVIIVTRSGVIETTGSKSSGIIAISADSTITVSGRISVTGAGSFAVLGGTYTNTLNLEGDYDITGIIDLGGSGTYTDTVNINGIGAGTATSIVFHNVETINHSDTRLNVIKNGNIKTLTIDRPSTATNNGCTLNANTDKKPFDPTLPLLALLAGGYLLNRKLKFN